VHIGHRENDEMLYHRATSRSILFLATLILNTTGLGSASVSAEITLLGTARLEGQATDHSGLTDKLHGGVPHNRLGGISAIDYTGKNDEYVLLPDRGPADGAAAYLCRFHRLKLVVKSGPAPALTAELLSTTMLTDESNRNLSGSATAFDAHDQARSQRFDPEGLRVDRRGNLYLSDEYGPAVYRFSSSGKRTAILNVPRRFLISHPAAAPEEEAAGNSTGRQPNGGLEGLAITPDNSKLFAAMQRPLIQDSKPGKEGIKRHGTNTRIIEFDVTRGTTREYLYPLDDSAYGVSEILAVNGHEFLILERDGKPGTEAVCKKIFKIDLAGATDLTGYDVLPPEGIPAGLAPARKSLFLDLLAPRFGLAGESFPEKIEGLAFGPTLPDGRRLLIVAIDNDFQADKPILLHAFAVDRSDLPGFGW
jgi:hypothetical protein